MAGWQARKGTLSWAWIEERGLGCFELSQSRRRVKAGRTPGGRRGRGRESEGERKGALESEKGSTRERERKVALESQRERPRESKRGFKPGRSIWGGSSGHHSLPNYIVQGYDPLF